MCVYNCNYLDLSDFTPNGLIKEGLSAVIDFNL